MTLKDCTTQPNFDESIPEPAPKEPIRKRKVINDATTEAIVTALAGAPDAAPVLVHTDEFAGLIGSFDAYRHVGTGRDRSMYLTAKDGKPYVVARKGSGTIDVPALAIALIATVQDDKLAQMGARLQDDGLLQRFALVVARKTGRGEDVADDLDLNRSIPRVANALADLEPRDYRLAPDAACELNAIEDFKDREAAKMIPAGLRNWLHKTPNEFGRYSLAFHLITWASGMGPALGEAPEGLIPREAAARARRYIEVFLFSHARHIYQTVMNKGEADEDVRWVAGFILARGIQEISARDMERAYRSLRGRQNRHRLMSAAGTLENHQWLKLATDPARKNPKWRVNPAVHDGRFQAVAYAEAVRRESVVATIHTETGRGG